MMFLINIECLGTYVVRFINEKNLKFKCFQPGGGGGACEYSSILKVTCSFAHEIGRLKSNFESVGNKMY